MTKPTEIIACPACGTELTLEHLVGSLDDERAFARLVALSVPMAHLVVRYIALFAPAKQRLTLRKKVRLIQQLLPDLQRLAITHKGREWPAPLDAWEQAIEQMLAARDAARLQLPLTGHGYLYAVLAGLAEKHAALAEQRPRRDTVTVRGQTMEIGTALDVVYGGKDPALAAIEESSRKAAPMPDAVRERIRRIKGAQGGAA